MQRINFVIGVALLIVASTLAVSITTRVSSREAADSKGSLSSSTADASHESKDDRPTIGSGAPPKTRFVVTVPDDHPNRAELLDKAAAVEEEANANLAQLSTQLELSSLQRERLFPILARSSESYDPVFIVDGIVPGTSPLIGNAGKDAVNKILDPEQQDQLMEDEMNNIILWQEIIDTLQKRLEEETPRVPAPGAPLTRQRSNLYDLVDPQPESE